MKKIFLVLTLTSIFLIALSACSGSPKSEGDTKSGEELFSQMAIGSQPGCKSCHSLDNGVTIVGPSLAAIATRAGSQETGKTADEYLRQSILEPNAFIVEGFPPDVMPKAFGEELTSEQVNALVAYLMTLK